MRALLFSIALAIPSFCFSQNSISDLIGTWRGAAMCKVINSPCVSQIVLYNIKSTGKPNTVSIQMNKVVNGLKVEMGKFEFIFDESKKTLICQSEDEIHSLWQFKVNGTKMHGTLTIPDGTIYRIIDIAKLKNDSTG